MATKTEMVMQELAELFSNNNQVQAVPSATVLDLKTVREIIRQELNTIPAQEVKQTLEIKTPSGIHEVKGVQHEKFAEVLAVVNSGTPVYLYGPAGTGKSHIAKSIAAALGFDFYMSNCITQEFKLTGFIDAHGVYQETSFYKAYKNGGIFFIDEMDGSTPEALININTALANGYFDFPNGRINAHENFRCIAAGNTLGTGADMQYTGRFVLDASSMDRFYFVHIDYSKEIENMLANGNKELLKFAYSWRSICSKLGIQSLFTYRTISQITTLQEVIPLEDVLKGSLIKGLDTDSIVNIVLNMYTKNNRYIDTLKKLYRLEKEEVA